MLHLHFVDMVWNNCVHNNGHI